MADTAFCFDLETTSADSSTTTPVQICLVSSDETGRRVLMNSLVRPGELISEGASKVHGITNAMVAGMPDYVIMAWQAHLLTKEMGPKYLVSFNGKLFDEPIIDRCLGFKVFEDTEHLDVLDIAYRFFPMLESHKLGAVYEHFVGRSLSGAHDASADVIGTLDVLAVMRKKIGMTMAQLAEDMRTPKPYPVMPIGKHKGKLVDDVGYGWAKWMSSNATNMRADLQATVDYILANR